MRSLRHILVLGLAIGILAVPVPGMSAGLDTENPDASALEWTILDIMASDLEYDPISDRLFIAVRPDDPNYPYQLLAIEPLTQGIDWSLTFGTQPGPVEVSADGSLIYVALNDQFSIAVVDPTVPEVIDTFSLPSDPTWGPLSSFDIAVSPTDPDVIAVAMKRGNVHSAEGVVIFEEGVMRPNIVDQFERVGSLAFGADEATLYGSNTLNTGAHFVRMSVDENGVNFIDATKIAMQPIEYLNGLIYFAHGVVVDPTVPEVVGMYVPDRWPNGIALLPDRGVALTVSSTSSGGTADLSIFDFDNYALLDDAKLKHEQPVDTEIYATIDDWGLAASYSHGVLLVGDFPRGVIRGRVTDAADGDSVFQACVYVTTPDGLIVDEVETSLGGWYESSVPPGDYRVLFADCHYIDYFWEWHEDRVFYDLSKATPVVVGLDETITIDAALTRSFTDSIDSIFADQIWWMYNTGITAGCGPQAYCPDATVTRGQMAAFLVRALDLTETSSIDFTDDDSSIFETSINKLATAGITKGCNPPANDQFCPNNPVTRGQMAAFLVRALGLTQTSEVDFVDDNGSVFETSINKLATAEITKGCNPPTNDQFCPNNPVTRGQMAAFLFRALEDDFTLGLPATSAGYEVSPPRLIGPSR